MKNLLIKSGFVLLAWDVISLFTCYPVYMVNKDFSPTAFFTITFVSSLLTVMHWDKIKK